MSLSDLIFAQKGILFSIGLALLLLMVAGILAAIPYVRRFQAQQTALRAQARAAAQAAAQRRLEAEAQSEQVNVIEAVAPVETSGPNSIAPAAAPESVSSKASPAVSQPAMSPAIAGGSVAAALQTQTSQPESENKDAPSSAMQDLLSSVFSDEEGEARREMLLKGLNPIDITELLGLCNRVVSQLRHSGSTSK